MNVSFQVLFGSAAIVAALFVALWAVSGSREGAVELTEEGRAPDQRHELMLKSADERAVRPLLDRIGAALRRLVPAERIHTLERKLQQTGDDRLTVERVLALKVLLTLLFGTIGVLVLMGNPGPVTVLMLALCLWIGWFGPNALIESRIDDRKQAIRREVSDTIDQLNVMVRAGLGIDAALARLASHGQGPLADEFARVMQDMRFGINRHTALSNMAERVDIPELRGFVAALAQADALGLPISDTLRIQSEDLRDKRQKAAEEQAMKLPVKIIFPMVVCILPVLFITILGPAAIRIFEELG